MSESMPLQMCLCVEDVDNCQILLSQIGAGHLFGPNQQVDVTLQGSDHHQLEELCCDLQDCAFPLITGVSTATTLSKASHHPDVVMVLLADRTEGDPTTSESKTQLSDILGLVQYTSSLTDMLADCSLDKASIVLLGDLAHTAASLVTLRLTQLSTPVRAGQVIALSGTENVSTHREYARGQGQMRKVTRFCEALRQWWTGAKVHENDKAILGTKFVDIKDRSSTGDNIGYFFSAPVDYAGPMNFCTQPDLVLSDTHVKKVKVQTDMAHTIARHKDGLRSGQTATSTFYMAHL